MKLRSRWRVALLVMGLVGLSATAAHLAGAQDPGLADGAGFPARLAPTLHPPLPERTSQFWYVPDRTAARAAERPSVDAAAASLARGVSLFQAGRYTDALEPLGQPRLLASPLGDYARYYGAWAHLKLDRLPEAVKGLEALATRRPAGYLAQAVDLRRAEAALAQEDPVRAAGVLAALVDQPILGAETVLLTLADAWEQAGELDRAIDTYWRVWVDHALTLEADTAGQALLRLDQARLHTAAVASREIARAEALYAARRWAPAREAFRDVAPVAGDQAPLVQLRIAACDYQLKRYTAARNAAAALSGRGRHAAEARYLVAASVYGLKQGDRFAALVDEMVADLPADRWTEEALNLLGSHYLIGDDDAKADETFRRLLRLFPRGRHAERAHWKVGWNAYRAGQDADAVRVFEQGAATFPRADYRPAWLYWSARAHERQGRTADARARYRLTVTDYQNSYYGRLAARRLGDADARPARAAAPPDPEMAVPTGALIRLLVSAELFDDAEREIRHAQRVWGDGPALQATLAWVSHRQGLALASWDRFNRLRGGINLMKRAYPQYIAAGGEALPPDALGVLFPLDYWALIRRYATAHGLDPYLMAALIQQESTFTADVRSGANAYGLMQLIPAAGRQYARKVGLGRFSVRLLTQPEANVRMGMAYFKDLSDRFGGDHYAIASYNAGPNRVSRWRAEKPDLPDDEFIDDIPFPETQNYVKKVLGMAEDYRRIYGGGVIAPGGAAKAAEVGSRAPAPAKRPAKKAPAKKKAPKKSSRTTSPR